ncbi:MAG TPA: DUF58 domain-containing protein [Candidatus Angelobacter sp.]|jgi:uncharacterized protein (DUF58 family)|nr:DUF58 domain-containing protein [Candidatus Angelobacter sp.]
MMQNPMAPEPVKVPCKPAGRLGFGFGRRFFLLLLVGGLWAIPAFWDLRFLWIMVAWDLCAIAGWGMDLRSLPHPLLLKLERSWTGAASLRNTVDVVLKLENPGKYPIQCRIVDDVPPSLRTEPPVVEFKVGSKSTNGASYPVRPLERGDIHLGKAYVRYTSAAHFAERWAVAELKQHIRIFPDLEEARKHNIYLTRARQIELEKRLIRQRGVGREFESLREYQEGDEFRNICWTATARRGKHVTKLHQVERSQAVWLIIDAGRLLRTKVGELSKLDMAANASTSLAQLALYSGDRVGLLVYGRKIQQRVGLGRGLPHMRAILEGLASAREEAAEADHLQAAAFLLQLQKQRALIIWITDLADTSMTPEVIESASQILSKHLLLFVVMAQTDLLALAGKYPETAEEMYAVVAAQELVQRRETLLTKVRNSGALTLEITPNKLTTTLVNQYLEIKERNLI